MKGGMGINVFKIDFDDSRGVYYSGQTLSGRVIIILNSPKLLNALYVTVRGAAKVLWEEKNKSVDNGNSEESESTVFTSEEMFFSSQIYLIGNCGITTHIPQGRNEFPFTFHLPQNLPTCFEGKLGHIRYTIKATLNDPQMINQDAKVAFSVISHVDLNMMPALKKSVNRSDSKTMCCCCCASGPLEMTVHIPFCGVVAGQDLPVSVDVENASNVAIGQVKCILIQQVTYVASRPHKKEREGERHVRSLELGSLQKNSSNSWERVLRVPSCPPTLQKYCSIIKVNYLLRVQAITVGCHTGLDIDIPLTVGTVPLVFHTESGRQAVLPTAPVMGSSAPTHQQLLPPSYEACVFGAAVIEDAEDLPHTYGAKQFTPLYPVFKI